MRPKKPTKLPLKSHESPFLFFFSILSPHLRGCQVVSPFLFRSFSFFPSESLSLSFSPYWRFDRMATYDHLEKIHANKAEQKSIETPGPSSAVTQSPAWQLVYDVLWVRFFMVFKHWPPAVLTAVLGPNCSSQVPLQDGTLQFQRKCSDCWCHFYAIETFASRLEPNGALFWGYDLEFILMMKNTF